MSVGIYMDQHVPEAITQGLRDRGIDVLTAHEDSHSHRKDDVLLARALELKRIIVTQDADFLAIAADRWRNEQPFATVVYGHQLRTTIGQAIADLELIAETLESEELKNHLIYLPL